MTTLLIRLSDWELKGFQAKVGKGNVSATIRQFIQSMIAADNDISEVIIRRNFQEIAQQKRDIDSKYDALKGQIDAIELRKKEIEKAQLQAMQAEQLKMADIKHNTMKSELSRLV